MTRPQCGVSEANGAKDGDLTAERSFCVLPMGRAAEPYSPKPRPISRISLNAASVWRP